MRRAWLFLLFAGVVTFGFVLLMMWDQSALPTEQDVAIVLYGEGATQVSAFGWPDDRRFVRVGDWDFSVGIGAEGVDRVAFVIFAAGKSWDILARPATWTARLRARFDPDCFASSGIIEFPARSTSWFPPDWWQ